MSNVTMACSGLSDAKFDVISEDQSDMIWFCRLPALQNSPSGNEKHS